MKVTREATVAVEGGVQPGIIVGRHAILKRGTRGDFVNARRYLTIYRSLINYLHNRSSPSWSPRFLSIRRVNIRVVSEEMLSATFQFASLPFTVLSSRLMHTVDY